MKKITKITILIIILIAIALLVLFVITGSKKPGGKHTLIKSIYLEKIPAGSQFNPDVKGGFAMTFKKDDQIALRGEANFIGKTWLTAKILKEGETAAKDVMPTTMVKPGSFGICCISVPQETGKYYLHFYTEGTEEELSPLSFEVVK